MKNTILSSLNTIDGETLMNRPLQPLSFVVDTLISQGLHILAGSPKVGKNRPVYPACETLYRLLRAYNAHAQRVYRESDCA